MSHEEEKTINLFEELGISKERSHEIREEIETIRKNSRYTSEMLAAIPETYDRESIVMGVFLAEILLRDDGRLLPENMSGANVIVMPVPAKEILDGIISELLDELKSKIEEDEPAENSTKGDPTQN